jgi:hypothetical protein
MIAFLHRSAAGSSGGSSRPPHRPEETGVDLPVDIGSCVKRLSLVCGFSSSLLDIADTVETKILQKAANKRKLEALVISHGEKVLLCPKVFACP